MTWNLKSMNLKIQMFILCIISLLTIHSSNNFNIIKSDKKIIIDLKKNSNNEYYVTLGIGTQNQKLNTTFSSASNLNFIKGVGFYSQSDSDSNDDYNYLESEQFRNLSKTIKNIVNF